MVRTLQAITGKHAPASYVAGEAMTRGMGVSIDYADEGKVKKATGELKYFVDVAPNYDGINAIVEPQEASFESIAAGDAVILIPVYSTEVYATSAVTGAGALNAGDKVALADGVLAAGADGDVIFDGEYTDPTGIKMYRVVKA